jgi:3-deoxy-7-phosphoheptulonate synthase
MEKAGLTPRLMIDFSHANSHKQYEKQLEVGRDVAGQITRGDIRIIGAMIESHLVEGHQALAPGKPLVYGQSITDACLSWDQSAPLLDDLAKAVRKRRAGY